LWMHHKDCAATQINLSQAIEIIETVALPPNEPRVTPAASKNTRSF
jgi:hypothetical protein